MGDRTRPARSRDGDDSERGRSASAADLRLRLATAAPAYLSGAFENPALGKDEMVFLLRNRAAGPQLLAEIGRDRRWTRLYDVKKGLVRHPRTPPPLARSLVAHLYWRDLAETAEDLRVHPAVRRGAEEILKTRLQQLALGERISLARRASPGIIAALRESSESGVLRALLGNRRLVEMDAVTIASSRAAPRESLGDLAEHPIWGIRRAVRTAVLRNPRTPVRIALRIVERLPRPDLLAASRDPKVPKIARVAAARRLDAAATGRRLPRRG